MLYSSRAFRFIALTLATTIFASTLTGCVALVAGTAATAAGVAVAKDRRTAGTVVEDSTTEAKVYKIIDALTPQHFREKVHAHVVSYNGNVLLLGQVPNAELVKKYLPEIKLIPKVRSVHNELTIGPITSMAVRSNDSLITTKVKAKMLAYPDKLDGTKVKVVTEDSIVYLLGIVSTDEASAAVDIARHVKGVRKVVKVFEYLPNN